LSTKWLIPAIAGIALMVSACGNNAAPNYTNPNNTTLTQRAGTGYGADGMGVRNWTGYNTTGAGTNTGTPYGSSATDRTGFGAYTTKTYGTGVTRNGNAGNDRNILGFSTDGNRNNGNGGIFDWNRDNNYGLGTMYGPGGSGYNNYPANRTGGRDTYNDYNAFTSGNRPYHAYPDGRAYVDSIYQTQSAGRGSMWTMRTGMARLGYAQVDRNRIQTNGLDQVYVDRDALAKAIGNVTASCPGVQRSTVLVTDEEILVGLQTTGKDGKNAKQQAKQNALSIAPRYYKVYVSDNPKHVQEIIRTASRSSNVSTARTDGGMNVESLVKSMGGKTEREEIRAHAKAKSKTSQTSR